MKEHAKNCQCATCRWSRGAEPVTPGEAFDAVASWPKCATCGKGASEGNHATDLDFGHDYEPVTP